MRPLIVRCASLRFLAAAAALVAWLPASAQAGRMITVPVSVVGYTGHQQGVPTCVMKWDEGGQPDPIDLRWGRSQVPIRGAGMGSVQRAFRFAVDRVTPTMHPTGVLSLYATFTGPSGAESETAEAALTIGFLALLKGDSLNPEITITGTLDDDGRIGPVAQVEEKTGAAARAGYRILLVPRGQFYAPRLNRIALTPESNVWVREVDTIDEAYEIMTGKRLF